MQIFNYNLIYQSNSSTSYSLTSAELQISNTSHKNEGKALNDINIFLYLFFKKKEF